MLYPVEMSPAAGKGCHLDIMDGWSGVVVVGVLFIPMQLLSSSCFHRFFAAFSPGVRNFSTVLVVLVIAAAFFYSRAVVGVGAPQVYLISE